jgi:hypothetical protein
MTYSPKKTFDSNQAALGRHLHHRDTANSMAHFLTRIHLRLAKFGFKLRRINVWCLIS